MTNQIGRYTLSAKLADGVYRAQDSDGRTVVLKPGNPADNPRRKQGRALREQECLQVLEHPNIVRCYGVDEHRGHKFLVLEYVAGRTLEDVLKDGPIRNEYALNILRQTATALDYLHARGFIHRDLKPLNIMVDDRGRVKLIDLETARPIGFRFEVGDTVFATPEYESPEQVLEIRAPWSGLVVDGRSDGFSLAGIGYKMLTGSKPFWLRATRLCLSETLSQAIEILNFEILSMAPRAPRSLNPAISPGAEAVLLRGLAKDPDDRFATCTEFVDALAAAI